MKRDKSKRSGKKHHQSIVQIFLKCVIFSQGFPPRSARTAGEKAVRPQRRRHQSVHRRPFRGRRIRGEGNPRHFGVATL